MKGRVVLIKAGHLTKFKPSYGAKILVLKTSQLPIAAMPFVEAS
jgi:hypothetical protein